MKLIRRRPGTEMYGKFSMLVEIRRIIITGRGLMVQRKERFVSVEGVMAEIKCFRS